MDYNKETFTKDVFASVVVFLVALPISLGIAMASGVEPIFGVLSAVVGGIVVSGLTGAPLQISGPSTGLAVMVLHVVQTYGASALVPLGLVAGAFQISIAVFRFGHLFQATPPALIKAMLSGIGFLIILSQIYILLRESLSSDSFENIINLPSVVMETFTGPNQDIVFFPLVIASLTVVILAFWSSRKETFFHLVPGSLIAILVSSILALVFEWKVRLIHLPEDLLGSISNINYIQAFQVVDMNFLLYAVGFAFVASVETMLCVSAVDKIAKTNSKYNKTILAQGIGNIFTGLLGAIPVVGVISRTAANLEAGARTKASGFLHGIWIALILVFPAALEYIPISALAGLLLFIGYKLLDPLHILDYFKNYNKTSWIFGVCFILTITVDLLVGVLAGFGIAIIILLFDVLKFDVMVEEKQGNKVLKFTGKLSFLDLPVVHKELAGHSEETPSNLEVCLREVDYLDPAIREHLKDWKDKMEAEGHKVKIKK